jgi:hypothetical protein
MPVAELYRRQAALLVSVVPFVAVEKSFALKGGTAINLFVRDLPRISVESPRCATYKHCGRPCDHEIFPMSLRGNLMVF